MKPLESNSASNSFSCQVCGQDSDGKRHYGALVCRACAAFFRRSGAFKNTKTCKKNKKCDFLKKGFFTCKYCRLQKCHVIGMSSENFQYEREPYIIHKQNVEKIPSTIDTFCGRSNLIIFRAPQYPDSPSSSSSSETTKNFIDVHFLVEHAQKILLQGPESPVQCRTRLEKLALGLNQIMSSKNVISHDAPRYGKEESLMQLEYDVLNVAKWLTHFEDFQKLDQDFQMKMLQGVWHVWWKLQRVAFIAQNLRRHFDEAAIRKMEKDHVFYRYDQNRIDMSWLSKYSVDELRFFINVNTEYRLDGLTRAMIELDPSNEELSFMLGQLCFHHVGKQFQGEILRVAENFQEILANDLHGYYVNQMKQPYYMKRLAKMMKINNQIQQDIYRSKTRTELAIVFDIFCVEVSHPEMFIEM